jgi:hypothetical protein
MLDYLSWLATGATIIAATLTASNLGSRITGYGFIIFTVGSLAWLGVGAASGQPALVWTNAVLTLLNLFGIWRWLGREAKIEQGSHAAALASTVTPGEALFPVSMLTSAPLMSGEEKLGSCVDAMVGCTSGRLAYLIVSEGGIVGAGERLRKLPWQPLAVDDGRLTATLDPGAFRALEEVPRDHWPAR